MGSSLSCGKEVTLSKAVSTSAFALAISQSGSNSRDIRARPSFDVLFAPLTPSTPSKTGSKTRTMAASTSSAPAPCQTILKFMLSIIISGKNCDRILGNAKSPATIKITKSKLAIVLWRVKYDKIPFAV